MFTVAGPVPHEEVLRTVRRSLERLPRGRKARPVAVPRRSSEVRIAAEETGQAHLALGFHTCSRTDPGRFALRLLSVMLGENMSSRLFQTLRERFGYCYSTQSSAVAFEESGALCVYTDLDPTKLARAVAAIRRECSRFSAKEPAQNELRMAAQYAIGQTRLALDSSTQQSSWMAESLMAMGRVVEPAEVEGALLRVTGAEVHACAKKYLRFEEAGVALVGPGVEMDELDKMVRS